MTDSNRDEESELLSLPTVDQNQAETLQEAGFETIENIAIATDQELLEVEEMTPYSVGRIKASLRSQNANKRLQEASKTSEETGRVETKYSKELERPPIRQTSIPDTSAFIITLLGIFGIILFSRELSSISLATACITGVLTGAIIMLFDRDGLVSLGLGSIIVPIAGFTLIGTFDSSSSIWNDGLVGSVIVLTLGLVSVWTHPLRISTIYRSLTRIILIAAPTIILAIMGNLWSFPSGGVSNLFEFENFLSFFIFPQSSLEVFPTFFLLLAVTAGVIFLTARILPISELAPSSRRSEVADAVTRLENGVIWVLFITGGAFIISWGIIIQYSVNSFAPIIRIVIFSVGGSPLLRGFLVLLIGISVFAIIFTKSISLFAKLGTSEQPDQIIPFVVGVFILGFAMQFLNPIFNFKTTNSPIPFIMIVIYSGVFTLLLILLLSRALGFIPDRTGPSALVGIGLVSGGIIFGIGFETFTVLVIGVAAGIVSWDLGDFGVSIHEDVGRSSSDPALEISHAVASIVIGTASLIVVFLIWNLGFSPASTGAMPVTLALLISIIAVVTLTITLRG